MNEYTLDYIVNPEYKLYQRKDGFRMNVDTRTLAQFVQVKKEETILDIGTNNGALLVYLDQFDFKECIGVEIVKESYENALLNQQFIKHPCTFIHCDIKEFQHNQFDVIVSNPPFFSIEETNKNVTLNARQLGRIEVNLSLNELMIHASRLLKSKGRFYFVHRPSRLNEIMHCLHENNFQVSKMQFGFDSNSKECKNVCIEAIKDSSCKCNILPLIWL
ncbi:tRNA1(Val) (adenine(37)-N6)-methyltransferase [Floccifex sp.]|uniref:tRNA1(Val) (adenine(37)-N6)-methyltransferase n=1 Tax=Floccifex sp. TaxID=2815810 RepID=UPI003F048BC3